MRFFRLTLAYDGTAYCGWQLQPGRATIQGALEQAIRRITAQPVRTVASGRTDAGVHALGQVVSFACHTQLPADVLVRAINAHTPDDIHVVHVEDAPEGFHAIRDAVTKRYRYVIQEGPGRDLFSRYYSWYTPQPLDCALMQRATRYLIGTHDFRSFEAAGAPRKTTVRTIFDLEIHRRTNLAGNSLQLEVEADGFLYNMVRNIVGTLVLVGRGSQTPEWVAEVLAAKDRSCAGPTAPALGLMLMHVCYEPRKGES